MYSNTCMNCIGSFCVEEKSFFSCQKELEWLSPLCSPFLSPQNVKGEKFSWRILFVPPKALSLDNLLDMYALGIRIRNWILWAEINPLIKILQFNIKSGLVDLLKECLKKLLLLFEDMESSSHISTSYYTYAVCRKCSMIVHIRPSLLSSREPYIRW